jgi:multidrug efflux pump subunit AcrA (membrane-fusion protein)
MKHGISELEWSEYVDGSATAEVRDRIETHFIGCLRCWEFYERMCGATDMLVDAGEEARQTLTLEDRRLHAMLGGAFSRLRAGEVIAVPAQVKGRLDMLETMLAPFWGTQAVASALQTAAKNSPARTLEKVTLDNWEQFLERLTAIAAAICGETFAGLVWERGQL